MNVALPIIQVVLEGASLIVGILSMMRANPPQSGGPGKHSEDGTPRSEEF